MLIVTILVVQTCKQIGKDDLAYSCLICYALMYHMLLEKDSMHTERVNLWLIVPTLLKRFVIKIKHVDVANCKQTK